MVTLNMQPSVHQRLLNGDHLLTGLCILGVEYKKRRAPPSCSFSAYILHAKLLLRPKMTTTGVAKKMASERARMWSGDAEAAVLPRFPPSPVA